MGYYGIFWEFSGGKLLGISMGICLWDFLGFSIGTFMGVDGDLVRLERSNHDIVGI